MPGKDLGNILPTRRPDGGRFSFQASARPASLSVEATRVSQVILTTPIVQVNSSPDLLTRIAALEAAVEALSNDRRWIVATLAELAIELHELEGGQ